GSTGAGPADETGVAARRRSHGAFPRRLDADAACLSPPHPGGAEPARGARRPGTRGDTAGTGVPASPSGRAGYPGRAGTAGEPQRISLRPHVWPESGVPPPSPSAWAAAQTGPAVAGRIRLPGQHRHPVRFLLPGAFWQSFSRGIWPHTGPVAYTIVIFSSQITLRLWAKEVYHLPLTH